MRMLICMRAQRTRARAHAYMRLQACTHGPPGTSGSWFWLSRSSPGAIQGARAPRPCMRAQLHARTIEHAHARNACVFYYSYIVASAIAMHACFTIAVLVRGYNSYHCKFK